MLKDDGDIVRGLGFVTLYGAYAEEQVEGLLRMLHLVEPFTDEMVFWGVSRQIKAIKRISKTIEFEGRDDLLKVLDSALDHFKWRNEVVHGRIYADFDRSDKLKSSWPDVPDRVVTSAELYELANHFHGLQGEIYRPMIFKLPRFLQAYKKPA